MAVALATVLVAVVYIAVAPKRYEAEADLLVTPVSSSDPNTTGLGLITESSDPTQDISTAAKLVSNIQIARAVKASGAQFPESAQEIYDNVTVVPVAQSTLVSVTASADSASEAAALANGYAQAAVSVRTNTMHRVIGGQLPALRARLAANHDALVDRVTSLTTLSTSPDPTIRVASLASVPTSPTSPKPKLAIAAGLIGGLILGLGAAFASQALDPRLRREEQVRELFLLPLLARVPKLPERRDTGRLEPLSNAAVEAYRTLRATLAARSQGDVRSVLVTSSTAGEGKTTTALNLARVLAQGGNSVILIEGDLRRPSIVQNLSVRPVVGLGAVLVGSVSLEEALFTTEEGGENLQFLLAERSSQPLSDRLSLPAARDLLEEAERLADYVVVDSPPLTEVVDALPLAQNADAVLIVARLGTSRLNRLRDLGDMLAQSGITPAGIVLTGADRVPDSPYYADAVKPAKLTLG